MRGILTCYNCGVGDNYKPSSPSSEMRRLSSARRSDKLRAASTRSRSAERSVEQINVDQDARLQHKLNNLDMNDDDFISRRAMSDLYDSQGDELLSSTEDDSLSGYSDVGQFFPTLDRFPLAATKNKNCWSEPPVSIFSVRGDNYFKDKKKIKSGPYIMEARGSDIFLADNNKSDADLSSMSRQIMGGQLRRKPTLAINFRFPWGYMNLYFEIPSNLTPYLNPCEAAIDENLTPSEKTLAKWLMGDEEYKNERLKLVPYVAEGPWVVRNMVTGRPALIGKKLPVTYHLSPATECDAPLLTATLDIGNSSATAKRIVSVCRRYMSALTVDIGFVIQAECESELPEQMLGSIRVHGPDPLKAPKLSQQKK